MNKSHMNKSHHTQMSYIRLARLKAPCHRCRVGMLWLSVIPIQCVIDWLSQVTCDWVMSHVNESSCTWMSHVTRAWVMSNARALTHHAIVALVAHWVIEWVILCVIESCHMSMCRVASEWVMSHVNLMSNTRAAHCNTLQHTATHYNTLQHTATHCNTRDSRERGT